MPATEPMQIDFALLLQPNPGAIMMDLGCRSVFGMLLAADCAAKKPGATIETVIEELRAQYGRAKKDLRRQAHSLFKIPIETMDEFHDRLMADPQALADYEKTCDEIWAKEAQSAQEE